MNEKYQKNVFLKKKKLSQVTVKNPLLFSMNDRFKKTPRPNWEIQMDWENDAQCHQIKPG